MFNIYKAEKIMHEEQQDSILKIKTAQIQENQKSKTTILKALLEKNGSLVHGYRKRIAAFMVDVSSNEAFLPCR